MHKKSFSIRKSVFSLLLVLVLALGSLCIYAEYSFRKLSNGLVRLHVVANSDTEEDQTLKLRVRDQVLTQAGELLAGCTEKAEAVQCLRDNADLLAARAQDYVRAEGYPYTVAVRMEQTYFPTRYYDSGALPAGVYTSLRVEIGEAAGHNWWCVLFPPLCFVNAAVPSDSPAPTGSPADAPAGGAAPTEKPFAVETNDVTLRFKVVDIFQKAKHRVQQLWAAIVY